MRSPPPFPFLLAIAVLAACTKEATDPRPEPPPVAPADAMVVAEVPPVPLQPVVNLAIGISHSCALHADGIVSCWGSNSEGQLGDGTQILREQPVRATAIGGDVVELAANRGRTCARKRDRSVWCWGGNPDNQPPSLTPVKVPITGAKQISGTCAVRDGGAVTCWTAPQHVVVVGGVTDAVQVATSSHWGNEQQTCAVRASGGVACWRAPGEVTDVQGVGDAVAITVGFDFACARLRAGTVSCWGQNDHAQLGRGVIDDEPAMQRPMPLGPGLVEGLRDVVDVAAGHMHACARTATKRVVCWGQKLGGDLVFGSNKRPFDMGLEASVLGTGGQHACALRTDGKLACWGRNEHGQLGIGWSQIRRQPTRVHGLDDAVGVLAAYRHSCAVRRTGALACWGGGNATVRDVRGLAEIEQVVGTVEPCTRDRAGTVVCIEPGNKLKRVALGAKAIDITADTLFGCAIVGGGTVRCWGNNEYGMFGNDKSTEQQARLPPQPGANGITDAVVIASGPFHACAVRATGGVACWGHKVVNQSLTDPDLVPVAVAGIADAKQLALGTGFSCALRATGRVACWGVNERGELGNGSAATAHAPTEVTGLTDAVQITANGESACARRASGKIVCWGRNVEGQLGDGAIAVASDPAKAGRSRPVDVPGVTGAVDVSTSGNHTCAVLADGGVVCWGIAAHGEVGTVAAGFTTVPMVVAWP